MKIKDMPVRKGFILFNKTLKNHWLELQVKIDGFRDKSSLSEEDEGWKDNRCFLTLCFKFIGLGASREFMVSLTMGPIDDLYSNGFPNIGSSLKEKINSLLPEIYKALEKNLTNKYQADELKDSFEELFLEAKNAMKKDVKLAKYHKFERPSAGWID